MIYDHKSIDNIFNIFHNFSIMKRYYFKLEFIIINNRGTIKVISNHLQSQ